MTWIRIMPAIWLVPLLMQAQVKITDRNTIEFESLSPRSKMRREAAPAMQISYKSATFVVSNEEDLSKFQSPFAGRKTLGRLLLVTTCSADCESKDPQLSRTVFVDIAAKSSNAKGSQKSEWIAAAVVDRFGMSIQPGMFTNPQLEFAINGSLVHSNGGEMHLGNSSISHYYVQVFERNELACRRYKAVYGTEQSDQIEESDYVSIDLPWSRRLPQVANGIVVGAPKVYDSYALRGMLNETLQKIRTINPFVANQITGSYGSVQGVTRDQSYVNVQAQAGYAPSTANTSGVTDQISYCAPGYIPAGPSACTPASTGSSTPTATSVTQTINPPAAVLPTIPSAPAFNPVANPGSVTQSSADALVEQVQLSGQLQMYQLLLEGAQSDLLFVQNSRAIANRAQTTVGFPVSIDPPRQFRHAVAEVRVLVEPFPTPESGETQPVSIVNLLPSQKTYNVAKITSKQRAFGGGAVIEQVASFGVSTGKSKDRLYLAKDTDTVALQYDHPSVKMLHQPLPEKALTGLEEAVRMQRLDDCDQEWFAVDGAERGELDSKLSRNNSVLFGWQFRPVLGADYVAGGPRQVFAQLALPEGLEDSSFLPAVLVQTRWREYDEKRQVVGPVFHSSCTVTSIKDPVIIQNPLQVHDVAWDDVGGGVIKIRAHGNFFSPGIAMQSGRNIYSPVTFDGQELQFFAPAKDLINNGEISLVGGNARSASLTIPAQNSSACRLKTTSLWAIPQADGTARMRLMLEPGEKFKTELPRTRPLVAIGTEIYGLKEKPFLSGRACDKNADFICVYHAAANVESLRAAGNYYVRELAWSNTNVSGPIRFAPFLASLKKYSEDAPTPPPMITKAQPITGRLKGRSSPKVSNAQAGEAFMISGSDLKVFLDETKPLDLKIFSVDCPRGVAVAKQDFTVLSNSQAILNMPRAPKGKTITIAWTPNQWPLSQEGPIVWDLTLPGQLVKTSIAATPSFINTGDSRTVTYTGADFSLVRSVGFENVNNLSFKVSADNPSSMEVVIPSAVTKDPGHKELTAITKDAKGKTGQLVLPIDVFKQ